MFGVRIYGKLLYIAAMFIRVVKKKNTKEGKTFFQYQLVQASRIQGKVKQQAILYLGSEPLLSDNDKRKMLLNALQAKIFGQSMLFAKHYPDQIHQLANKYFEKFKIKYKDLPLDKSISIPPKKEKAQIEPKDISSMEIEDSRTFGGEHLCAQVMDKLKFSSCLKSLEFGQRDIDLAHISIISRALFASSEYKTTAYLRDNSELQRLYGHQHQQISHYNLYMIADKLYKNKTEKGKGKENQHAQI